MEKRSHDTPMDFEYDHKGARVPADSPWLGGTQRMGSFSSPSKTQDSLFRTGSFKNTLPQTPIKNHLASFRENPILDFSSGAENASSPENADNEDTPDLLRNSNLINDNVTVFRGSSSPNKGATSTHRSSLSKYFTLPARFSPSHKQIIRRVNNAGALNRPNKRKRRDLNLDTDKQITRRGSGDSDYDTSRPSSSEGSFKQKPQPSIKEVGTIPAILAFIHNHPNLPHILSYYGETILNWFIVAMVMFAIVTCWRTIRNDVDLKAQEAAGGIIQEIYACREQFINHGCNNRASLGPSFMKVCDEWEACMNRDAMAIARGKISAHTFAEILNEFIEPLSYKFIFLSLSLITAMFAMPHILFGAIRKKEAHHAPQPATYAPQSMQSPFQQPAGFNEQYFTPQRSRAYDAFDTGFNAGRESPSKKIGGRESPSKRIGYH